jgi:hypothetical protein
MEELDQKTLTEEYITSYHYTKTQRAVAIIAVIIVLFGLIGAGTYLFLNVINIIKR